MSTTTEIRSFHIEIPAEQIDDLRRRIAATRWPTKELVEDRSQGVQLATLRELARYWTTEYDWRTCEARLNALPQFTTEIDGVEIHFIHVRSPARERVAADHDAWLARLGHRAARDRRSADRPDLARRHPRAMHSTWCCRPCRATASPASRPSSAGTSGRVAQAWAELMRRLGYTRYVAQGGDVGAAVTDAMGRQAPEGLLGIHVNVLVTVLGGPQPTESDEERAAQAQLDTFRTDGSGYFLEMATRPQTIGYCPAGFTRRTGGVAARPRHGQLREDRARLRRRGACGQPHAGQHPRQHHAVLADRHRRLGSAVVLGGRTRASRSSCVRPSSSGGLGSGRLHDVPRRGLGCPTQLGRAVLPHPHLLQRGRQGRPLRRLGGAGALLRRGAGRIQLTALMTPLSSALFRRRFDANTDH